MGLFSSAPDFIWSANADGLAIRFSDPKHYGKAKQGKSDEAGLCGLIRMQMLCECGQAEVREVDCGIFIGAADAVRLDRETREGFALPPAWPGGMRLQTNLVPQAAGFRARLGLVEPGTDIWWDWRLRGPILEVGTSSYLPSPAQYAALLAFQSWFDSAERGELENLCLLATLREAREMGCHIDLEAYRETLIANVREVSVYVQPEAGSGDLILAPLLSGDFPSITPEEIQSRSGQLDGDNPRVVIRVGKTIVLLDPTQTLQARALANRGRVPKEQVETFTTDPAKWMADHVFPDVETEFSPRVTGIGFWKSAYAGSMWSESEEWFGKQPQPEQRPGGKDKNSEALSEDYSDPDQTTSPVVAQIFTNDTDLSFGWRDAQMAPLAREPDFSRYARVPLEHQKKAVLWLLRHAQRALRRRDAVGDVCGFGAGALLADDMGLGKTFSTLIFLREWFDLWRATVGGEPPAVLVVAPLSLLENWRAEITKSYDNESSVFKRVLIAQSEGDMNSFRRGPGSRDKAVPEAVTEYGLCFGDGTERSLDLPSTCVLTTYQTLRDYRFSFAKAKWSAAIFDEAQNIKNPNALQTIAAKSLNALFRLTLTGTPVENHLGDFWSILDAAEPGPLGSFTEFRKTWINPMARENARMGEIGLQLRAHVGDLMLRRMKEDELTGLSKKKGHNESIQVDISREQLSAYDAIIESVQGAGESTDEAARSRSNRQLAALWQLRQVSLHPDLLAGGSLASAKTSHNARVVLQRSGKTAWLLQRLDQIKPSGEKVLIFCVQKKLQEGLARLLNLIYGFNVPVINGDTKATSRRDPSDTRLGLIEEFSERAGFGICILSPIAAGAGLNIVAANHVIHLERHWNPAKEDQATDRAYRIGQTREVQVYLPTTCHPNPERRSFDEVLHGLIQKKRGLQGALGLVPPQSVSDSELIREVFAASGCEKVSTPLDLEAALQLSWQLFEALIAVLYEKKSRRVILTTGGGDHGCDVVVLGFGPKKENILIQCKMTSRDELDSEVAVREVSGSLPFYEDALGVVFNVRCLHTTARKLSKRTQNAARTCRVDAFDRAWLAVELNRTKVSLVDLLAKDASRERVA